MNIMLDKIIGFAKNQTFTLEFNKNRSRFISSNTLESESLNDDDLMFNKIATLRFTSDFNYYLDKEKEIELFQQIDGVLIQKKYEYKKWIVSNESKVIDKYLCYKAEYIKTFIGRDNKEKKIKVIAWFAPSLPYNYGPKDYNGLPGLVLELQEKDTTYFAAIINLSFKSEFNVEFPKGRTVTQEEYEKKVISNN
jgi:GLPGLI family protein